ncbi:hypothetical protein GY45DRAFT_1332222 [Cubamyces sp. BRFM 1775]|nr:hypothetical protein GY45DRAFT_1332222 [Cubamyces sp. BRFM 1775]
MSTEHVPEELLENILTYALCIPSATFEAWREPFTFAATPLSNAPDILAVSKRWNTIGTPLVWDAVILRNPPNTRAFAEALQRPQTKQLRLAHRLRRLRIETGYNHFSKILSSTPCISDLFLGLNLCNEDTVSGLARTLKKINPSRLYLDGLETIYNQQFMVNLLKAVTAALPDWTNLKTLIVGPGVMVLPLLLRPLSMAPALEYVSLSGTTATANIDGDVLLHIASNPRLKVLQIREITRFINIPALRARVDGVPKKLYIGEGKNMVPILDFPAGDVVKPDPGPLPELPDKIWERILGYATHVSGHNYLRMDEELYQRASWPPINATRRSILVVCKMFYRLGLGYMYAVPHFARQGVERSVDAFIDKVQSSRRLAALVRVLYAPTLTTPRRISAPLTNLVHAPTKFHVFPECLNQLPDDAESALERMEQSLSTSEAIRTPVFLKTPKLRTVTLYGGLLSGGGGDPVKAALPCLETLRLSSPGPGSLDALSAMELRSLRNFEFTAADGDMSELLRFLEAHGRKLFSLSIPADLDMPQLLDLCPNITELGIVYPSPPTNVPSIEKCKPHNAITCITFPNASIGALRERGSEAKWYDFIQFLSERTKTQLPSLAEVRVGEIKWPLIEHEYRGALCSCVAYLLHEAGLTLSDISGRRWTRFKPIPIGVRPHRLHLEMATLESAAA